MNYVLFQGNVKKAMSLLEKATRLVSLADMFSENETVEEISTSNIQYLLLPALLGSLSMKLTTGERKDIVSCAEVYFKDFLKRCNAYSISNYRFKDEGNKQLSSTTENQSELELIESQVHTRANKIQKFKEQKELQARLNDLKGNMENENCDEEIKREYFLTMIKLFVQEAADELSSIATEKEILQHMSKMKDEKPKKGPQPRPLKPVIITRDAVQKAVYGAGYPSLPTMTVEEFYDKRVRDGIFPDPHNKPGEVSSLQEASLAGLSLDNESEEEKRERMVEEDDPQLLEQVRNMDEFKDEHRRGWGNRMNRS